MCEYCNGSDVPDKPMEYREEEEYEDTDIGRDNRTPCNHVNCPRTGNMYRGGYCRRHFFGKYHMKQRRFKTLK